MTELFHENIISFAKYMKPQIYVELGFCGGATFNGVVPYVGQEAYAVEIRDNFSHNMNGPKTFYYKGYTADFAKHWNDNVQKNIDMIFIDADHNKDSVIEDATNFYRWLTPDTGIMILHDTWPPTKELTCPERCGDAYLAKEQIKEILDGAEMFTLTYEYGLTLIRKPGGDWRNG